MLVSRPGVLRPDRPKAPLATDAKPTSIRLEFVIPCGNGEPVTKFAIQIRENEVGSFKDTRIGLVPRDKEDKFSSEGSETKKQEQLGEQSNVINIFRVEEHPHMVYTVVHRLNAMQSFEFRIAAINFVGQSKWSPSSIPINTADPDPPEKMSPPNFLNLTPHSLDLMWSPKGDGGAEITGYHVEQCQISEEEARSSKDDGGGNHWKTCFESDAKVIGCRLENLKPQTPYFFRVCAINSQGKGSMSDASRKVMLPTKRQFIIEEGERMKESGGTK